MLQDLGFGVQGLVWGFGVRVWALASGGKGFELGFKVWVLGSRVTVLMFGVRGFGFSSFGFRV
jgi:hypothetical protein